MKSFLVIAFILAITTLTAQKRSLYTVNFDFNKYEITPVTATILDFIIYTQTEPPSFTIELYGHCDSIGSYGYNDTLSVKRTEAVKNYLAARGLKSSTITKEEGLGKRQPLNNNASDSERYLNRRVEITLVSIEKTVIAEVATPQEKQAGKITEEPPTENNIAAIVKDPKTKIGTKIRLKNLNFIGNRHVILPESIPVLMELLDVMEKNPTLEISIEGHICCRPNNGDWLDDDLGTYNLSEMRAKTVYDYLVKNGIDPRRLSYKGYGHMHPIYDYPETDEDQRIANRRVEIKIIKK